MRERLLCVVVLIGCSKAESREAAPAPKPVPAVPSTPAPGVAAPSLVPNTRVDWPAGAGRWVGIANRAGMLHVVAGDANGDVRDVSGARFEDEYIEVDDSFQITPSGDRLIVARSMHKMSEAYREVFLLAVDGSAIRVVERWSGLEGERAPFEGPALPPDSFAWTQAAMTIAIASQGAKARLVALDASSRATNIVGGSFTMDYDPESITVSYEAIGDRLVVRMSTAENIANNCERFLLAPASGTPRVVERWRGECGARAPFEAAP